MSDERPVRELLASALREYPCRGCGRVLAVYHPDTLVIGPVRFARVVTFACRGCGRRHTWAPAQPPQAAPPARLVDTADPPC